MSRVTITRVELTPEERWRQQEERRLRREAEELRRREALEKQRQGEFAELFDAAAKLRQTAQRLGTFTPKTGAAGDDATSAQPAGDPQTEQPQADRESDLQEARRRLSAIQTLLDNVPSLLRRACRQQLDAVRNTVDYIAERDEKRLGTHILTLEAKYHELRDLVDSSDDLVERWREQLARRDRLSLQLQSHVGDQADGSPARIVRLLDELREAEADDLSALSDRLDRLEPTMQAAVEELELAEQQAAEQEYVAQSVREVLGELGYELLETPPPPSPESVQLSLLLRTPRDRALSLEIDDNNRLATEFLEIVRDDGATDPGAARTDCEAVCADLAEFRWRLEQDRGLQVELEEDMAVGEAAFPCIEIAGARSRSTKRTTSTDDDEDDTTPFQGKKERFLDLD